MADVLIQSGTPYRVAFELMHHILSVEGHKKTREEVLDLYRECLMAVQQPGGGRGGAAGEVQ